MKTEKWRMKKSKNGKINKISVIYAPTKESFSTCVSLLPLKGVCPCFFSRDRITSFNAKRDVLISAPSILESDTLDWYMSFHTIQQFKFIQFNTIVQNIKYEVTQFYLIIIRIFWLNIMMDCDVIRWDMWSAVMI